MQVDLSEKHSITIYNSLHHPYFFMEKNLLFIVKEIYESLIKWKVFHNVKSLKQSDGSSCGITTVNTMHQLLCPAADVWDPIKPLKERTYYFTQHINSDCQVHIVFL